MKFVSVDVDTPKGKRTLKFIKYSGKEDSRPCDAICPYAEMCEIIKDPRCPENPDRGFMDFCGELNEREDEKYLDLIPVKNTIEENLKDVIGDTYQALIKKGKLVCINDVIDELCPGWCGNYNKEHSQCTSENKSCLLAGLFKKVDMGEEMKEAENLNE